MDAIRTPLNRKVFRILTAALLGVVPAFAAGSLNVNEATSAAVPLNGANTSAAVSVTSTGDPISFTTSIAYDATGATNWLAQIPSGTTPVTVYIQMVSVPSPVYGPGPFTATITLVDTGAPADTATIKVTFTPGGGTGPNGPVTVLPASLGLQLYGAGSVQGTLTAQSDIPIPTNLTVAASSLASGWSLTVNQAAGSVSSGAPFTITVTASAALTASATYSGTVTITPAGYPPIQVGVTLTVFGWGNGNSDLTLTSGPTTASNLDLNASLNTGGIAPAPIASLAVESASNQPSYQLVSVVYQSGAGWLSVNGYDGSTPETFPISTPLALTTASGAASLADGIYQATVNVGETGVAGIYATVGVTLYVNTTLPAVSADPASWTIAVAQNGGPQSQTFTITALSGTTLGAVTSDSSWIQPAATVAGNGSLVVVVDPTGLAGGPYSGNVIVNSSAASSPLLIPICMAVFSSGWGGLTLSSSALTFNGVVNGPSSTQTLTVSSATGVTAFTAASQVSTGAGWLSISPAGSLTTNQAIAVTVNPAGLALGTYIGGIQLTANGATQEVEVSLVVSANLTGGNVNVAPPSLNLSYTIGGTAPSAQLQVTNAVSGSAQIPFTVSALNNPAWFTVTPASADTPASIAVGVNTAGLTAGPYSGTIQIAPTGGQVVNVAVLLTVAEPSIAVDNTSLTFTYHAGDPKPASQTVHVTGGAAAFFTAMASSSAGWLSVTPGSGIASPATLTISVDPTGLTTGTTYQGTIAVTGANGATGSATIIVTLYVLAPLPIVAGLGNAASGYSGSVAPGELISIYGTQLGPSTPVPTQLDPSGHFVATTLGGVQVFVSGYPAPVLYASSAQVNAVVPYEVSSLKSVSVWVTYLNQTSNSITLPLTVTAPGVFTLNASGSGQGLVLNNADDSVNGPAKPAAPGGWVIVYVTGEGQTLPSGTTGKITVLQASPPITPAPLGTVVPWVDGQVAASNFAGEAPGFVSGVMQVNVQIPSNARSGDLPLAVSVGGNMSQTGVTVRVQ
jgi:uncharacterized protein (TIGR03437 family)